MKKSSSERVLLGARAHFFAHGFRGVTMDDLAAELGMSKRTVYTHFSSKADLLAAVIDDKLRRVDADLARVVGEPGIVFSDRLQNLLECMRGHAGEIQPAFVRDVRQEAPELFARVQEGRRKLIHRHIGKLLDEGRKAGRVRKDIPVKMLIEILVNAVDAIMNPMRVEALGIAVKTGYAQIVSVFLYGALVRSKKEAAR